MYEVKGYFFTEMGKVPMKGIKAVEEKDYNKIRQLLEIFPFKNYIFTFKKVKDNECLCDK